MVSLNVEGDKHLPRVIDFLKREKPDVVCLQEVFAANLEMFKNELNLEGEFFPTVNVANETIWAKNIKGLSGMGILTNIKNANFNSDYYFGKRELVSSYIFTKPNSGARVLAWMDAEKDGRKYRIAATHFTWSSDGKANAEQKRDIKNLIKLLDKKGDFVLCGDFNAPRGGEIFKILADRYQDNIPRNAPTTLDAGYHRMPGLRLVVDGLFSTEKYKVSRVRVVNGISDHMAIAAEIGRML